MPLSDDPVYCPCILNGHNINLQIDSGASVSTFCYDDATKLRAVITKSNRQIRAYNGGCVDFLGIAKIKVNKPNSDKSFMHELFVVSNSKDNLLGRDLCRKLGIK